MAHRRLCLFLAALVCALGCAGSALAAPGDTALFEEAEGGYFVGDRSVAVVDGALYVLNTEKGLYMLRPGDSQAQMLMDLTAVRADGTPITDDSDIIPLPSHEAAAAGDSPTVWLSQLIGGGDAVYAFDRMYTSIWKFDAEAGVFQKVYDIPEKAIVYYESGNYGNPRCATFMDGAIYLLIEDYSSGERSLIRRLDPAAGVVETVAEGAYSSLMPYRSGKLLVGQGQYGQIAAVGLLDLSTGQFEARLKLNDDDRSYSSYTDLAYDAASDAIYLCRPGEILRSMDFGPFESVAYLPVGVNSSNSALALPGGYYVLATYENVYVRNVDPQYKPADALVLNGLSYEETTRKFSAANPGVPIRVDERYFVNAEELARALSQPDAADLYRLSLSSYDLGALYDKGYIADLSGDQELAAAVARMTPAVRDAVTHNGKVLALPFEMWGNTWGANLKAFEAIGLTPNDVPKTYMQLLDFIDRWEREYRGDYPEMMLLPAGDQIELKTMLFSTILMAQIGRCSRDGVALTFDTPAMRALLTRLEQVDFSAYPGYGESGGYGYSSDEMEKSLFSESYNLTAGKTSMGMDADRYQMVPMLLTLDEGEQPVIAADVSAIALSPAGRDNPQAIDFLRFYAGHMPGRTRISLYTDENEPVENYYYAENVKQTLQYIARLEKSMAQADDENDKKQYRQMLDDANQNYENMQKNERYEISAADIAGYRELERYLVVNKPNALFTGSGDGSKEVFELIQRFVSGQIKTDQFLMEINQKLRMMALEG
ncbi:MAG: extracellular solute-binding protein [Clostridiales bacterium]|nr:extracellular solute-binding protein [Clostridiales bacterium]